MPRTPRNGDRVFVRHPEVTRGRWYGGVVTCAHDDLFSTKLDTEQDHEELEDPPPTICGPRTVPVSTTDPYEWEYAVAVPGSIWAYRPGDRVQINTHVGNTAATVLCVHYGEYLMVEADFPHDGNRCQYHDHATWTWEVSPHAVYGIRTLDPVSPPQETEPRRGPLHSCEEIHGYSYVPVPNFLAGKKEKKKKGPYFGVELEMDSSEVGDRDEYLQEEDWRGAPLDREAFYAKEDGSIEQGFEVVSHPATLQWWRETDLASWMNHFVELGYRSYHSQGGDSCGMHVHVSRKGMRPLHILKFLCMFEDEEWTYRVSRRRSRGNLSQWAGNGVGKYKYGAAKGDTAGVKYWAVNVAHRETLEVRIFRGTLHAPAFLRNIELVHALYVYSRDCSLRDTYPEKFETWLDSKEAKRSLGSKVQKDLSQWLETAPEDKEDT